MTIIKYEINFPISTQVEAAGLIRYSLAEFVTDIRFTVYNYNTLSSPLLKLVGDIDSILPWPVY